MKSRVIKCNGFSLIEMSVVLIIISLIVAGTLSAQSIIHTSKLRFIVTEIQSLRIAVDSFHEKFNQLPGDFNSAHRYWGSDCDAVASRCNGNNNGVINWNANAASGGKSNDNESHRLWQHLSLGGFIENKYSGVVAGGDGDTMFATEEEMYFSKTKWAKYFVNGTYKIFDRDVPKNHIIVGRMNGNIWLKTLTVKDAMHLDQKMDDGTANTGRTFTMTGGYALPDDSCSESWRSNTPGKNYNLTNVDNNTPLCVMSFYF